MIVLYTFKSSERPTLLRNLYNRCIQYPILLHTDDMCFSQDKVLHNVTPRYLVSGTCDNTVLFMLKLGTPLIYINRESISLEPIIYVVDITLEVCHSRLFISRHSINYCIISKKIAFTMT